MATPLRMLILEDIPADAELIVHELRRAGFDPDWQRVDNEADFVSHLDPPPDIILVDYNLPQWDAPRALRAVQERGLDIPVIMISGTVGEDVAVECLKLGAADYFLKDRLARLGLAVTKALEDKRLRVEKRQADAALRQREAILTALLNAPLETVALLDNRGNVLSINESGARRLGSTLDELVGRNIYDVWPPVVAQTRRSFIEGVIRAGEPVHFEDSRSGRYYASGVYPVFDPQSQEMIGTAIYASDITARKHAEEREKHLTAVLRAIRGVNQLIVHEKDRDRLLHGACDSLIATRGYHTAWIALVDESGALLTLASAGLDVTGSRLEQRLHQGEWVYCAQQVLAQPGTLVIADASATCGDCPLASTGEDRGMMSVRLEHEGHVFGVLTVSAPIEYVINTEEHGLLEEIGGDIAFALHSIDLEHQRQQTQEMLAANYQLLHTVIDSMPDLIYAKNVEGRFILKNVADARHMGAASPEEAIGKTDFDYFPPELAAQYDADDRAVIQSGIFLINREEPFISADGSQGWLLTSKVPLRDSQGNVIGLVGISRDITDLRRAERAEHEQRVLAEALGDTAAALISALDFDSVMNTILESVARVVPHDAANIMLIEDDQARVAYWRDYRPERIPFLSEFRIPLALASHLQHMVVTHSSFLASHTDQHPGWARQLHTEWVKSYVAAPIRSHGDVIGFLNVDSITPGFFTEDHALRLQAFADQASIAIEHAQLYEEISRRADELEQRVEERTAQLNHAKERIEAILNSSSDVLILCRENGAIDQVNPAFDKTFGSAPDEIINRRLTQLVTPEHARLLEQAFETVVRTGRPKRLEVIAHYQESSPFDADMVLSPVVGSDGRPFGVICSLRDITERKQMEAQLRKMLEYEMKLSELKSRYVSMAAHDLRNPLAVIQSSISLIHQYGDRLTDDQREEKYNHIQTNINVMVAMLDDILTLGKVEAGKLTCEPALLNVIAFCENIVAEMKQATVTTQIINFSSQGDYGPALLDARLLRHILGNLLSNAIKYSPEGRPVTLTVCREPDQIMFRVQDQGIGIPEDDQKRLFETFHRASNARQIPGTGLGLAIVKQSVELHGGTITFESEEGHGTTFTVVIPQTPSEKVHEEDPGD